MAPSLIAPMSLVSVAARRPRTVAAGSSLTGLPAVVAALGDDEWLKLNADASADGGLAATRTSPTQANFNAFTILGTGTSSFANDGEVNRLQGSDGVLPASFLAYAAHCVMPDGTVIDAGDTGHGSGGRSCISTFDPLTGAWTLRVNSASYRPRTDAKPAGCTETTSDTASPVGWPDKNVDGAPMPGGYHRYHSHIPIDATRSAWGGTFGGKLGLDRIGAPWVYDTSDDSIGVFLAAAGDNELGWHSNIGSIASPAHDVDNDRLFTHHGWKLWTRKNLSTAPTAEVLIGNNGGYGPKDINRAVCLTDPNDASKKMVFHWLHDDHATREYTYWANIGPPGSEGVLTWNDNKTFTNDVTALIADNITSAGTANALYRRGMTPRTGSEFLVWQGGKDLWKVTVDTSYDATIAVFGGAPTGDVPDVDTTSSGANWLALRRIDMGAELSPSQRYAIVGASRGKVWIRPDREAA